MRPTRRRLAPDETRRVIIVTDGDHVAFRALRVAARRTGCRLIGKSAGNPTPLSAIELVYCIRQTPYDPVIVMLDDNGDGNEARGEQALCVLLNHPDVHVIATLAVASNTTRVDGVAVDFSIDHNGQRVETAVDKDGLPCRSYVIHGDTVDILRRVDAPLVIGIGDIGKMNGRDAPERGAPVTTSAIEWILLHSNNHKVRSAHNEHRTAAYRGGRNGRR
ncbi:stage V sporulation protein AE [Alicyclobacillus fastidiosus]|uniref:Stage V sporulation protein AE n=1 Tax=Alicyclobacillus fastidiosus TaxID=392011 RepID=A0ABV5AG04_9BACL|nr:stage V sporulation protein AE [Alicyclobacillus fastidiosus]WEH11768.1 stage V sporulation protein AE [Alicyclobacillus fastidiosus]